MPESLEYDITTSDFHKAHYPSNAHFVQRRITLGSDTLEDIRSKWSSYLKEDGKSIEELSTNTCIPSNRLKWVFSGEAVPVPLEFLAICEGLDMLVSGIPFEVAAEGRLRNEAPLCLE